MHVSIVIADEPFPVGMACTNRILTIARGLVENGIPVQVICLVPMESEERGVRNREAGGVYNNIPFTYTPGTTIRSRNPIARKLQKLRGLAGGIAMLLRMKRQPGPHILMLWIRTPMRILLFALLAKIFGFTFFRDMTEYPHVFFNRSLAGRIRAHFYDRHFARLFDAISVMTRSLGEYYRTRMRTGTPLLLLPMTVESSRFTGAAKNATTGRRYVAYCGYVGGNKDGVPILVKAFSLIAPRFPDVDLYIIGDSPGTDDLDRLKALAIELGIADRTRFTGRVGRDDMPGYLCNASVLALARPSSLQSEGGFPTKLGEYLSTGNPVVVTRVGEIPEYLEHGVSAFIAQPDSPESFAEQLAGALADEPAARKVGSNGRAVALASFDYQVQGKNLVEFLKNATSRRKS